VKRGEEERRDELKEREERRQGRRGREREGKQRRKIPKDRDSGQLLNAEVSFWVELNTQSKREESSFIKITLSLGQHSYGPMVGQRELFICEVRLINIHLV
jgi:hypothetical protein